MTYGAVIVRSAASCEWVLRVAEFFGPTVAISTTAERKKFGPNALRDWPLVLMAAISHREESISRSATPARAVELMPLHPIEHFHNKRPSFSGAAHRLASRRTTLPFRPPTKGPWSALTLFRPAFQVEVQREEKHADSSAVGTVVSHHVVPPDRTSQGHSRLVVAIQRFPICHGPQDLSVLSEALRNS